MAIKKRFKLLAAILLAVSVMGAAYHAAYNVLFPTKYRYFVEYYSAVYSLDTNLVYAVIKAESNFEAEALSSKNAKGLMQITGSTGKWAAELMGNEYFEDYMLFDPETNIEMGCWYLKRLINNYDDVDTALAAYNAGSGNVSSWIREGGTGELDTESIPFAETKKYIERVNKYMKIYDFLYN